jgi:spore coat polysaccharide biosynthesis protein SpsF
MTKVDAVIACRVQGSRLYGKPLQNLNVGGPTVIESLISYIKAVDSIDDIVFAVSEESENDGFVRIAEVNSLPYVKGDQDDVLGRMIKAAKSNGTDVVFRTTSENPFMLYEFADELIHEFIEGDYDWGSYIDSPDGTSFELIKLEALEYSHKNGQDKHRSELVSSYIFENQDMFKLLKKKLPENLRRPEIRLTVDYAEDLVFCQSVWRELKQGKNLITIEEIINFWDSHPEIRKPLESIGVDWGHGRLWE